MMDRMEGKWVLITGATSGIGRATALALNKCGAKLLLVSRNCAAGKTLVRHLAGASGGTSAEFIEADLSSLEQVRAAARQIRERTLIIDVLINNAGARFDNYASTPDGCERTFAANHLGHFLLTGLLADRLLDASSARIVTVSSSAAAQAKDDELWEYGPGNYDRKQAYAKSKLANLLFALELARRIDRTTVTSLAVDPGVVATRFARNNGLLPWLKHLFYHARRGELLSPSSGADTIIYLATTKILPPKTAGGYFHLRQPVRACPAAYNTAIAANLWKLSVSLTASDPFKETLMSKQ